MNIYQILSYLYSEYFTSYKDSTWREQEIRDRINRDKQGQYY